MRDEGRMITLTYTLEDGTQKQMEFDESVREVQPSGDMWSGRITHIDLTPLARCTELVTLRLYGNLIQNLDLSPIASCTELENLLLDENQLQSVDLSPLSSCSKLQNLGLDKNDLQGVDLSPLASCGRLQSISLHDNNLQRIDLIPLASCPSLSGISLWNNPLENIDLTPLTLCENLENVGLKVGEIRGLSWIPILSTHSPVMCPEHWTTFYERPTHTYPLSFLISVVKTYPQDLRILLDVLKCVGLGEYGFVELDPNLVLDSFSQSTTMDEVRERLITHITEIIIRETETDGPTTGLSFTNKEVAARFQRIIEMRAQEIERVRVGVDDEFFDLRELYVTAYGYEVLSTLPLSPATRDRFAPDSRLKTDLKGLEMVKQAFGELGFDIKTAEKSVPGVKMSDELKQVILWIVENHGHSWFRIYEAGDRYQAEY